jgi:hypothetical protein
VSNNAWSQWTDAETARRRAGGRRHYNAVRRFRAMFRRLEVARLLSSVIPKRGEQTRIARALGVSRATISRDIAFLRDESLPCPSCGRFRFAVAPELFRGLESEGTG